MDPIFFTSQSEFRKWLTRHGASESEVWIGFYKVGASKTGITYKQALDEALCFGWIDGLLKSIDDSAFQRRFTPRKVSSIWSNVNIARVGELMALGVVTPAGTAAFAKRQAHRSGVYSFESKAKAFAPARQRLIEAHARAWAFFTSQAPSYQRVITHWVESAVKDETRDKRMRELIARSDEGLWVKSAMLHQPKSSLAAAAASKPQAKAKPQANAQPEIKATSMTEAKPASKAKATVTAKRAANPAVKPAAKQAVKPAAKPAAKPTRARG